MKISITGIFGRMGREVAKSVVENEITDIAYGLCDKDEISKVNQKISDHLNIDSKNALITDDKDKLISNCDIVIDFSSPNLTLEIAAICKKYNKILISGTTGFTKKEFEQLKEYSSDIAIFYAANMSLCVNLMIYLSRKVSSILHDDYDAEILEMHHNQKIDAPSGTALAIGEAVAKGRNLEFSELYRKTRDGIIGKRKKNEIGFASLRGGSVVGDHEVIFAGQSERFSISHKASDRNIYANGALRAAIWIYGKKAGIYSMKNILKDILNI